EAGGSKLVASFCPSCGAKLVAGAPPAARGQEAVPAPPPLRPEPEPQLSNSERKIISKAEERLRLLERFLSSAARIPHICRDPGTGDTLASYVLGLARVRVAKDGVTGRYFIDEPTLSPEEILAYSLAVESIYMKAEIPEDVVSMLAKRAERVDIPVQRSASLAEIIAPHIRDALRRVGIDREDSRTRLTYYVTRELFGYGVVNILMEDPEIEDINCLGPRIYIGVYHRGFSHLRWLWTNAYFRDDEEVNDYMNRLAHSVGHGLTAAKPYGDFALPSGERFAGVFGREISARGPGFTIRKFAVMPWSLPHMVKSGVLSPLMAAYLWYALEQKAIIGLAGPTGSGKTSLFNALLSCLHPNSTVYTIEDTYELYLPFRGWRPTTVKRPSMLTVREVQVTEAELIKMALRMRPDYIVVGEVRTEDAIYHLLNAAFTGHGGGFTFHADSSSAFFYRLAIMLRRAELSESLLSFFWGCGIMSYYDAPKGRLRRVTEIAEIVPDVNEQWGFRIHNVFRWSAEADSFYPNTAEELYERSVKLKFMTERVGISRDSIVGDLERKVKAIALGVEQNISDALQFHEVLQSIYYGAVGG
ncbi:MAG: type II/IV secretion system ATPase subunit, partial [Nitrososphaerota archaeon]